MKHFNLKPTRNQTARSKKAVSNVISTIILTGILLTILIVSMFVSTNVLNAQLVSTEFNQAQSNMLLLDSTVQDVSLRPGAGGYVQFNERQGGIGLATTTDSLTVTVQDASHQITFDGLVEFVYSGGTHASAAVDPTVGYKSLKGNPNPYVNLMQGLGFLRLEQDNGGKIKLDYNRVRIASAGLIDSHTNLVQVTFIHLVKGAIEASSGTVSVTVQNIKTSSNTGAFDSASVPITVQYSTDSVQNTLTWPPAAWTPPEGTTRTVVVFSEIQVESSLK